MNQIYIYGLEDISKIAEFVNSALEKVQLLTFQGQLGAGKTTLIKNVLSQLGVAEEDVTSPTFTYVNVYKTNVGKVVYHFDLYRVDDLQMFYRLGFDEYLQDADAIILIEWPEVVMSILPKHLEVMIDYEGVEKRRLSLKSQA